MILLLLLNVFGFFVNQLTSPISVFSLAKNFVGLLSLLENSVLMQNLSIQSKCLCTLQAVLLRFLLVFLIPLERRAAVVSIAYPWLTVPVTLEANYKSLDQAQNHVFTVSGFWKV